MTGLRSPNLLRLCDQAIHEAGLLVAQSSERWIQDQAHIALMNLTALRTRIENGTLWLPEEAGLGLTRFLGEWAEGSDLYEACRLLEECHRSLRRKR